MPNKKTHQKLTIIATITSFPLLFLLHPLYALSVTAGVAVTWFPEMSPDLDINRRRFGPIGEFFGLRTYARLIPHRYGFQKRHWSRLRIWNIFLLSHIPFLGTLPRTILLLLPMSVILVLFDLWLGEFVVLAFFLWLGMSYSDIWHSIADLAVSDFKAARKVFWRRRKRKYLTKRGEWGNM